MKICLISMEEYPSLETSLIFSIFDKLHKHKINVGLKTHTKLLIFYGEENQSSDLKVNYDCFLLWFKLKYIFQIISLLFSGKRIFLLVNAERSFIKYTLSLIRITLISLRSIISNDENIYELYRCSFPESKIYINKIRYKARKRYLLKNNVFYFPVINRCKMLEVVDDEILRIINNESEMF